MIGKRRKNDARNKLFYHYFRIVKEAQPLFFVAENVDGILQEKYEDLRNESLALVEKDYITLPPFRLCASEFGAATLRSRVFFVGVRKSLGVRLSYEDFAAKVAEKSNVRTAFNGLPIAIRARANESGPGFRKIEKRMSCYLERINKMLPGVGDEETLKAFRDGDVSGMTATLHTPEVRRRFRYLKPGQTDSISKARKLDWEGLCPTLRAGTGPERGSFQAVRPIHPSQGRVITPREAARLQGFPDWFRFSDTKWHSFRQIGNSVSPLMGEGVMKVLAAKLGL